MQKVSRFGVLYADCPWKFDDKLPGKARGAEKHYPCLDVADLMRFPLPDMLDDSWLFLWRVHTHQEEAKLVMKAWGFKYASELIWVKLKANGQPHLGGMGRTLRMNHEVCLVGKRGRPQRLTMSASSVMLAKMPRFPDNPEREHSAKPPEMYDRIEEFGTGPYCELFAREAHGGNWTSYGNQLNLKKKG